MLFYFAILQPVLRTKASTPVSRTSATKSCVTARWSWYGFPYMLIARTLISAFVY
jgi:hypothetical protein